MICVVDASVAVKWYVNESNTPEAEKLLLPLVGGGGGGAFQLHAPELIAPEFGSIVWKKNRRGDLTQGESERIIEAFGNQNITLHSHKTLLQSAFAGAIGTGQTVYDWMYLSLAVALSCEMVTADEKFYRALENTPFKANLKWIADL